MVDYDSNMIKPVDSLQNIIGLSPAGRREQRNKRQDLSSESKEQDKKENNENVIDEQLEKFLNIKDDADDSKIDYCA